MSDIIIVDEEFKAAAEQIKAEGEETEAVVKVLIEAFTKITEDVAEEGTIADNFKILLEELSSLEGQFSEIYSEAGTLVEEFIGAIDEADDFLY